ncbi:DUF1194 domain-containing protein [Chthonobacter rhizosphaerae]|uniref:DUF1194 domain-containing protein n=1 Tax=Chthonobacter rhizosphaerae TaxID=2735553 RepID=UPI0015EE8FC9|nr:DUF1194 domain-containing protein [Chthonobacter rhizosphaerae]
MFVRDRIDVNRLFQGFGRLGRLGLLVGGVVAASASFHASRAADLDCVTTGLVFAIDASGSIDDRDYFLQTRGIASALRDPEVMAAIEASGGLAAAVVVWSDDAFESRTLPWRLVRRPADADALATAITSLPRYGTGSTDLGGGLWTALDLFLDPRLCIRRKVVDVSGDGRETIEPKRRKSVSLAAARARAEQTGVTVNGLCVSGEEAGLEAFYQAKVASGAGSFVICTPTFDGFGEAMRRKLLREIGAPELSLLQAPVAMTVAP